MRPFATARAIAQIAGQVALMSVTQVKDEARVGQSNWRLN
jgi:hypothetical protein